MYAYSITHRAGTPHTQEGTRGDCNANMASLQNASLLALNLNRKPVSRKDKKEQQPCYTSSSAYWPFRPLLLWHRNHSRSRLATTGTKPGQENVIIPVCYFLRYHIKMKMAKLIIIRRSVLVFHRDLQQHWLSE